MEVSTSNFKPLWLQRAIALAREEDRREKLEQVTAKRKRDAASKIQQATAELLCEAEQAAVEDMRTLGYHVETGEVSFAATTARVYDRKETGYYSAYKECARFLLEHPEMLHEKPQILLPEMLAYAEHAAGLEEPLPAKQFFYNGMLGSIRQNVKALAETYGYQMPRYAPKTLKLFRDYIRDHQPVSTVTGNGVFKFINGTHLQIVQGGRPLLLRDKRGIPAVRIKGTDKNIYTLLAEAGIDRETADAWWENSRRVNCIIPPGTRWADSRARGGVSCRGSSPADAKSAHAAGINGTADRLPPHQNTGAVDASWRLTSDEIDGPGFMPSEASERQTKMLSTETA